MGEWRLRKQALFEPYILSCRLCGKMIPRRYWHALDRDVELSFCDPECEQIYRTYWLPRYGGVAPT